MAVHRNTVSDGVYYAGHHFYIYTYKANRRFSVQTRMTVLQAWLSLCQRSTLMTYGHYSHFVPKQEHNCTYYHLWTDFDLLSHFFFFKALAHNHDISDSSIRACPSLALFFLSFCGGSFLIESIMVWEYNSFTVTVLFKYSEIGL